MPSDTCKMIVVPTVILCAGLLISMVGLFFTDPKIAVNLGAPFVVGGGALYFFNMVRALWRN